MRSKRKNYFLGLISLCLVAYHSSAEPLLQCVTESGFQEIGRNNNGIKAYVVERGQRGVYGRWYTIHDYDKTPKIGKRELINKNDAFAGTLTSMTILKDVGSHLNLTIQDRMNLRVIHSIHGTIFNPTTNDFTKFNLEHFGISKFADNSVHFFSWIYNGLDEEGKQTESQTFLYCRNPPYITKSDLYEYLENSFVTVTEVPYILLSSLKRKINNIATFRLSDRVNILGNKISSLKTVEWRIIGQYKNEYKINYRLRPNQDWQELTANITTIDPRFPENAHPLNAPSQQYYKFSYIDTITNGSKESDLEYWVVSVVADIRNSKNKISYHKWVNNKEEKINTKVVDDSYVITHKVPSIEKQKPISVSQGELEEKESN